MRTKIGKRLYAVVFRQYFDWEQEAVAQVLTEPTQ